MTDIHDESATFFVRRQGKVDGPWPSRKLKSEIKLKKLARFHEVSTDGETWRPASELEWLFPRIRRKNNATAVHASPTNEPAPQPVENVEPNSLEGAIHSSEAWFIAVDDEPEGPYTEKEILDKVSAGLLTHEDLLWKEDEEDWNEVQYISPFAEALVDEVDTGRTQVIEQMLPRKRSSMAAVTSLVMSILLLLPFALIGIGIGIYALFEIKKHNRTGTGFAYAGIGIGFFGVLVNILILALGVSYGWFDSWF